MRTLSFYSSSFVLVCFVSSSLFGCLFISSCCSGIAEFGFVPHLLPCGVRPFLPLHSSCMWCETTIYSHPRRSSQHRLFSFLVFPCSGRSSLDPVRVLYPVSTPPICAFINLSTHPILVLDVASSRPDTHGTSYPVLRPFRNFTRSLRLDFASSLSRSQ